MNIFQKNGSKLRIFFQKHGSYVQKHKKDMSILIRHNGKNNGKILHEIPSDTIIGDDNESILSFPPKENQKETRKTPLPDGHD